MIEKRHTVEKEWSHNSNICVVIMNHSSGCRCGYVGIKPNHPLYGKKYDEPLPKTLIQFWEKAKDGDIGKRGILDLFCLDPENPDTGILFDVHGGITYSGESGTYPIEITNIW